MNGNINFKNITTADYDAFTSRLLAGVSMDGEDHAVVEVFRQAVLFQDPAGMQLVKRIMAFGTKQQHSKEEFAAVAHMIGAKVSVEFGKITVKEFDSFARRLLSGVSMDSTDNGILKGFRNGIKKKDPAAMELVQRIMAFGTQQIVSDSTFARVAQAVDQQALALKPAARPKAEKAHRNPERKKADKKDKKERKRDKKADKKAKKQRKKADKKVKKDKKHKK